MTNGLAVERIPLRIPRLYPKQSAFVFDKHRYTICFASTKSGKSVGLLVWILTMAWTQGGPGKWFHWISPSYPVSKEMYGRLQRWLRKSDSGQRFWKSNESDLYIEMFNGSRIYFKGGDRPDLLYGADSYGIVIDEAPRCREEVWHASQSLTTATGGPIKIIGNMKGRKNWVYRLWLQALNGDPDFGWHKLDAFDAIEGGVIDAGIVEEKKRTLPENVFRELYLAEPSEDEGNPFGLEAIRRCVRPLSEGDPVAFGTDLARSVDYSVTTGLDVDANVCRFDRWQGDWSITEGRVIANVNGVMTLVDSTGVGDSFLGTLRGHGGDNFVGYYFTQPSKQKLVEGLALAIQQEAIHFPDEPFPIRRELESFEYVHTRTGVSYSAPQGLHDDCVISLALGWAMWKSAPAAIEMETWDI